MILDAAAMRAVAGPRCGGRCGKRLRVLDSLAAASGAWVPAGALCDALWPANRPADAAGTVRVHVYVLREKLAAARWGRDAIESAKGLGYRLAVPFAGGA